MFGKRILILSPHPDDEAVGAAAAIARAKARGASVSVAFLTNGVPAADVFWPWQRAGVPERVTRRWAEVEAAARRLGYDIALRQDIPTRTLKARLKETHALVAAALARLNADMLWAPAYEGAHQDHDAANCLAAAFAARVPVWEFAEYSNAGGRVLSQEFFAPNGGETVLELSETETAQKRAALALYASERGNLRHVGARREAFRPLAPYDYARPPHPGVLFYQRFQWVWPRHPRVDYARPEEVSAALAAFRAGLQP
jgi:LmbE family N-acetylglucosaminyl deacetylase